MEGWCKAAQLRRQEHPQHPIPPQVVCTANGQKGSLKANSTVQFLCYHHDRIWNLLGSLLRDKDQCFVSDRVYLTRLACNWLVILPQPPES